MKKGSISVKISSGMLVLSLLIGLFTFSTTYADSTVITIDGVNYPVDDYSVDSSGNIFRIVRNGVEYIAHAWAKQNLGANNQWAKTVSTGIVTYQELQVMRDLVGAYNKGSDVIIDGVNYAYDKVISGWDSIVNNVKNGGATNKQAWLLDKFLGAKGLLDNTYSSISSALSDTISWNDSSLKNYYNDRVIGTNNYASGTTSYYNVYNDTSKNFYNTYTNTYETVNNYQYNYTNNNYTYYTTNHIYNVNNNFNSTYVFNTTNDYEYSLYYKLPNGSNSLNLTYDQINGIRTDFNVSNYEINYVDSNMLGLFHFNGTNNNVINNNLLDYINFNSLSYVSSRPGYDLALFYGDSYYKYDNYVDSSNLYRIDFKTSVNGFTFNLNKDLIKNIKCNLYLSSEGATNSAFVRTKSDGYGNTITSITPNVWHLLELTYDSSTGNYNVYLDGVFKSTYQYNEFGINFYSSESKFSRTPLNPIQIFKYNYFLIDELEISSIPSDNHSINYLPNNESIFYTLPDTDTNNKILIQSQIPVNNFQFGGVRNSNSSSFKGDVYFYLQDGVITQIQQFDGADWVLVDGALYSVYLGKWVNAIGYSIYLGNFDYVDLNATDVNDLPTLSVYFTSLFDKLSLTIKDGFNSLTNSSSNTDDLVLDPEHKPSPSYNTLKTLLLNVRENLVDITDPLFTFTSDTISDLSALSSGFTNLVSPILESKFSILFLAPILLAIVGLIL